MTTNALRSVLLLAGLTIACGEAPASSGAEASSGEETSSSSGGQSTGETGTGGAPTTGEAATTGVETTSDATSETASSSSSSGSSSSSSSSSTGSSSSPSAGDESSSGGETDGACDPDEVLDAVSFNYVKTTDVGVMGVTAGFYNSAAGELVFLAASGQGVRVALDGAMLGEVEAPASVASDLDGAVYDPQTGTALLLDRDCNVAEVDPVTLAEVDLLVLDPVLFDVELCSGLALGADGNLYVASMGTDEVVAVSRDLIDEVARFEVQSQGITTIDGIAAIPGSENFLIISNSMPAAAILSASGEVVAPASEIGGDTAPLVGGVMPVNADGLLSVCANGQVWLCAGLQSSDCFKYAPEGGGGDVCGCLFN